MLRISAWPHCHRTVGVAPKASLDTFYVYFITNSTTIRNCYCRGSPESCGAAVCFSRRHSFSHSVSLKTHPSFSSPHSVQLGRCSFFHFWLVYIGSRENHVLCPPLAEKRETSSEIKTVFDNCFTTFENAHACTYFGPKNLIFGRRTYRVCARPLFPKY